MEQSIVLIGVGGLGSRHLQALSKLDEEIIIHAVDPSEVSIENAKKIVQSKGNIIYHNDMKNLPKTSNIAIIAVTSGIRRKVTEELLEKCSIQYIIFEKVLFNRVDDYYAVGNLLSSKGIIAWVDCARREWKFYQMLKSYYNKAEEVQLTVSGKNWGLGCNAIHHLDLLAYLSDTIDEISIDISNLDDIIHESKRAGYIEFTGELSGSIGKNSFHLISPINDINSEIRVASATCNTVIHEMGDKISATITRYNKDEIISEDKIECHSPYISELTNRVVESILKTGSCNLTPYKESMELHIPLIHAFLKKINAVTHSSTDKCNIT